MTHTSFPWYAYCFDHGHFHRFRAGETPWCTARWIPFDAYTEETALAMKQQTYGDAQFLHQLPDEQQLSVIELAKDRR